VKRGNAFGLVSHKASRLFRYRLLPVVAAAAKRPVRNLFDHLVGASEQHRRNFEAEDLRSREVDDQLELGRQINRQIVRLGAL
jgi:hypothetical protein